ARIEPSVVDEDGGRYRPERLPQAVYGVCISQVDLVDRHVPAESRELSRQHPEASAVAVHGLDVRAGLGEPQADRLAYPRRGTCHDGRLSAQVGEVMESAGATGHTVGGPQLGRYCGTHQSASVAVPCVAGQMTDARSDTQCIRT